MPKDVLEAILNETSTDDPLLDDSALTLDEILQGGGEDDAHLGLELPSSSVFTRPILPSSPSSGTGATAGTPTRPATASPAPGPAGWVSGFLPSACAYVASVLAFLLISFMALTWLSLVMVLV